MYGKIILQKKFQTSLNNFVSCFISHGRLLGSIKLLDDATT